MTYWLLLFLFLAFAPLEGLQRIALRNQYARQASLAYQKKNYLQAAALYEKVRQAEGNSVPTVSVQVNLAHAYFQLHEYSRASPLYRALLKNPSPHLQSMAATQLSVIEAEEGNFTKAIAYCKQAMTIDETNEAARFNYELLQKYLLLHPEKRQSLPPPARKQERQNGQGGSRQPNPAGTVDQDAPAPSSGSGAGTNGTGETGPNLDPAGQIQKQDIGAEPGQSRGENKEGTSQKQGASGNQKSNQAGQEGDAQLQTRYERLKKLDLSPEKARQLLDAMRQEETQYLQQLPRKSSKNKNKNQPDW